MQTTRPSQTYCNLDIVGHICKGSRWRYNIIQGRWKLLEFGWVITTYIKIMYLRFRRQKVRVFPQIILHPFPPVLELFMKQHSCGYYSAISRETSSFVVAENFLRYPVEKLLFIVMYIIVFTKFLTDGHQHRVGLGRIIVC